MTKILVICFAIIAVAIAVSVVKFLLRSLRPLVKWIVGAALVVVIAALTVYFLK